MRAKRERLRYGPRRGTASTPGVLRVILEARVGLLANRRRPAGPLKVGERMLILASLFLVFGIVSAANAEGAWVLWKHWHPYMYGETRWDRFETFRSEAECTTMALKLATILYSFESRRGAQLEGSQVHVPQEMHENTLTTSYECHADTVDPRGPKGK